MTPLARITRLLAVLVSATLLNACTTTDTDDYNTCALGVGFVGLGIGLASGGTGAVVAGATGGGVVGYLLCDEEQPLPEEPDVVPVVIPVPDDHVDPDADADGDGVPNRSDDCADTLSGVAVDYTGCAKPIVFDGANLDGFAFDSAALPEGASELLQDAVRFIEANPEATLRIAGHADSTGPATYNQGLSERRANSVYDQLLAMGVPAERMTTVGFGETQPISSNETESGRTRNRRVEVSLID